MNIENIKRANWLELLFDLIFVYAVSKATHILAHAHDGHVAIGQYITFILVIVPIWWTWTGHTLFSTRFDTEDTRQRLLTLTTMLAVVFWTAFINADFDPNYHGYLAFYVVIRLILVVMYWNSTKTNRLAIPITKRLTTGFLIGLTIAVSSIMFESPVRYAILYLGITVEIITPLLSRKLLKAIPVKSHHLPERYGLLTIILLGESVIMLASSLNKVIWNTSIIAAVISGFIIIAILWWIYFDLMESNILGQDLGTGQRILYGHLFIYIGLSSIAVFIGYSINHQLHLMDHLLLAIFGLVTLLIGFLTAFGWSLIFQRKQAISYLALLGLFLVSLFITTSTKTL